MTANATTQSNQRKNVYKEWKGNSAGPVISYLPANSEGMAQESIVETVGIEE